MKKICMILAVMLIFTLPVFAAAEGSTGRPTGFTLTLPEGPLARGENIPVEISITNISAVDITEPMSLYGPDGKRIKSFKTPALEVGEKYTWQGSWVVDEKELKNGMLVYRLSYSFPDENGKTVKKAVNIGTAVTVAEPGQETVKTETRDSKNPEADVVPLAVDPGKLDLDNGEYCIAFRDLDKIRKEGFFTAEMYVQEHYDGKQIRSLAPGNTVLMNGRVWTVEKMVVHSEGSYELYPVEEYWGYIAFWLQEDGTFLGVMDDWSPVIRVGEKKLTLPLPESFAFYTYSAGEREEPVGFLKMLDALENGGNDFVPYNTTGVFENGELVAVDHSDYPQGPDQ